MSNLRHLSDVANVVAGFAFSETQQGKTTLPTPFIKVSDFATGKDSWISTAANTVDKEILKVLRARTYPTGTIIFPKVGGALLTNKRARLAVEATFDNNVMGLIPTQIDGDYLFYFMRSFDMARIANTQSLPSVRASDVSKIEIPVPTPEKQRQIAARLKTQLAEVETARQAAQVQLRDAAVLKTKALESLFSNVASWAHIGDAAKLQSGYAFKSDNFKTSGVRLLRNANILPGQVYWDDAVFLSESDSEKYPSYALSTDDVLISLDRPIISSGIKVARVEADDLPALLVQRVGRFLIDPQRLDADYLYAYLQTDLFISKISGHDQSLGVPHISPSQVEGIEIPLPEVSVQRALSKQLNEVTCTWDVAAAAMRSQLNDLSKLPKAILAQAFAQ